MGKFDGILICSDLDETLLDTDKNISEENKTAIEYFMAEGGKFTFSTGRVPHGAKLALRYVVPNIPMICFNGAAIYDFNNDKIIWERFVDKDAAQVVEFVQDNLPQAGIEVCTNDKTYYTRTNRLTREHSQIEQLPEIMAEHTAVTEPWKKVIFMVEVEDMPTLRKMIADSEYADRYTFIQSYKHYYELLPKNSGKGEAMLELAQIVGIDKKYTLGIGDNENDLSLIKLAGVGVAVANAEKKVRDAADYITVDNNNHALAAVIRGIEKGRIKF